MGGNKKRMSGRDRPGSPSFPEMEGDLRGNVDEPLISKS